MEASWIFTANDVKANLLVLGSAGAVAVNAASSSAIALSEPSSVMARIGPPASGWRAILR